MELNRLSYSSLEGYVIYQKEKGKIFVVTWKELRNKNSSGSLITCEL